MERLTRYEMLTQDYLRDMAKVEAAPYEYQEALREAISALYSELHASEEGPRGDLNDE